MSDILYNTEMKIIQYLNDLPKIDPVKERMDIFVPDVNSSIPHRRGFVYGMIGSGGSGKSSLLLSMFKSKAYYRSKFDNIWLFVPQYQISSFVSVLDIHFTKLQLNEPHHKKTIH